jgi:hypothetical protein
MSFIDRLISALEQPALDIRAENTLCWSGIEKTRQDIQRRKKALLQKISAMEAEMTNLDWEWDRTCDEADQLLEARR